MRGLVSLRPHSDMSYEPCAAGMVAASLALLRPGGRMVELGKRDIWGQRRVAQVWHLHSRCCEHLFIYCICQNDSYPPKLQYGHHDFSHSPLRSVLMSNTASSPLTSSLPSSSVGCSPASPPKWQTDASLRSVTVCGTASPQHPSR